MVTHIHKKGKTSEGDSHRRLDRRVALLNELSRGKELALQLHAQLTRRRGFGENGKKTTSSCSVTEATTLDEILCCYHNVLSMIGDYEDEEPETSSAGMRRCSYESGPVGNGGGGGGGGGGDGFGSEGSAEKHEPRPDTKRKKKKMLPQWSEIVKVQAGTAFDRALSDGHRWRKYGQKKILGAPHPRNYYRCTHRDTQHCLATKQVQKSEADPTLVHVIYQGRHTCRPHHHPVNFTTNINTLQPANTSDPTHISEHAPPQPPPQPRSPPLQNSQPVAASPTHLVDPTHHHLAELKPTSSPAATPVSAADQERFFFRMFSFSSSAFLEPDTTDHLTSVFFSAPPPAEGAVAAGLGSPGWLSVGSGSGCSVESNPESDLSEDMSTGYGDPAAVLVPGGLSGEGDDGFDFMTLDEMRISDDVEFEFDDVEA